MDCALPRAQAYVCLTEALGLRFKRLFIDFYKGESELLTCLHSTKSIRIKGTTAELPLPRCGPAQRGYHPAAAGICSCFSLPLGLQQGAHLACHCPPDHGQH